VSEDPDGCHPSGPELSAEQMRLIGRIANFDAQSRMILLVDPAQILDQVEADMLKKFDRSSSHPIRLLIADDSALMRKLLEAPKMPFRCLSSAVAGLPQRRSCRLLPRKPSR
jgi:hypothetical protein